MWADRRKKHMLCVRLDDLEELIVEEIAEALKVDKSEALRRTLWAFRILFDPELKLKDALVDDIDPDKPLFENLRPFPELAHRIGI